MSSDDGNESVGQFSNASTDEPLNQIGEQLCNDQAPKLIWPPEIFNENSIFFSLNFF